jgi:type I restriction enzyme M protein
VIFFTKGIPTEVIWIYDARTGTSAITKKGNPLSVSHFTEFERCYGEDPYGMSRRDPGDSPEGRWRPFPIARVEEAGYVIDSLKWLSETSPDMPDIYAEPADLAAISIREIGAAGQELQKMVRILKQWGREITPGDDVQ